MRAYNAQQQRDAQKDCMLENYTTKMRTKLCNLHCQNGHASGCTSPINRVVNKYVGPTYTHLEHELQENSQQTTCQSNNILPQKTKYTEIGSHYVRITAITSLN